MNQDQQNRLVQQAINDAFGKPTAKTELDQLFERATEINKEVHATLEREFQLTLMSRQDRMNRAVKLYVDSIASRRFSKEELVFLLAFNCAKILTDQT